MTDTDSGGFPALACTRAEAREKLDERIGLGRGLLLAAERIMSEGELAGARRDFYTWHEYNVTMLQRLFTTPKPAEEYRGRGWGGVASPDLTVMRDQHCRNVDRRIRQLESLVEQLDLYDEKMTPGGGRTAASETGTEPTKPAVFIIHGSDREAALDLQKVLGRECREIEAVMFEDRVNRSLTIIENLEMMIGEAAFGLAIFTPDDFVEKGEGESYSQMRPNVVLELGWFYGHLGRRRAAVIRRKGTKVPSDLEGIYRIEYGERITDTLAEVREALRAAGLIT